MRQRERFQKKKKRIDFKRTMRSFPNAIKLSFIFVVRFSECYKNNIVINKKKAQRCPKSPPGRN